MNYKLKPVLSLMIILVAIWFIAKPVFFNDLLTAAAVPLMSQQSQQGEVGNYALGFKFEPPLGWVAQVNSEVVLLGHNTIPGLILVVPHQATTMSQMRTEMEQGLQDVGTYLVPSGTIQLSENGYLIADYSGYLDGTNASAKGLGVLFKTGGGAYIIAASTPEKYSKSLVDAAKLIATKIHAIAQNVNNNGSSSNLMNHFVGKWRTETKNTATDVYLYPNGVYSDNYESAYSGGGSDASWGVANQNNGSGKWSVSGNIDQGTLITISADGSRSVVEYKVHTENGRKFYTEYYFNGTLYWKKPLNN
jgi:hypothetical protein